MNRRTLPASRVFPPGAALSGHAGPKGRWPAAALLAVLLHLPLMWRAGALQLETQDSAGPARGAGRDRLVVLDLHPRAGATAESSPIAPAVAPRSAPQDAGGGGRDSYFARLRVHLQRYRRPLATGGAAAGTAVVEFRVDAAGRIAALRLGRSSGDTLLDAEALALVQRAAPVPPPPDGQALRLSVPVVFE